MAPARQSGGLHFGLPAGRSPRSPISSVFPGVGLWEAGSNRRRRTAATGFRRQQHHAAASRRLLLSARDLTWPLYPYIHIALMWGPSLNIPCLNHRAGDGLYIGPPASPLSAQPHTTQPQITEALAQTEMKHSSRLCLLFLVALCTTLACCDLVQAQVLFQVH